MALLPMQSFSAQNHWPDGVKKAHQWSPKVNLWIFFGPWDVPETLVKCLDSISLGIFPRHQEEIIIYMFFSRPWISTLTIKNHKQFASSRGGFGELAFPRFLQSYQSLRTRMDIFIEVISPIQPTVPLRKKKQK